MVLTINISNGMEHTCGSQNSNASQICGGYFKVSESLYTKLFLWSIHSMSMSMSMSNKKSTFPCPIRQFE